MATHLAFPALFSVTLVACSGVIDSTDPRPTPNVSPPGGPPSDVETPHNEPPRGDCTEVARAPILRRLSHIEYSNTVSDLLGETGGTVNDFPSDVRATGFSNQAETLLVGEILAEKYLEAAEHFAARAVTKLDKLFPCDVQQRGEKPCGADLIQALGARAFRRPLSKEQIARYERIFADAFDGGGSYAAAATATIMALLMAPEFLYRVEPATPSGRPDGWVVAQRLSYLLWGSMPDAPLFAAAQAGKLGSRSEVAIHAQRMLKDPRAQRQAALFHEEWLGLAEIDHIQKDAATFPTFTPAVRSAMRKEAETFVHTVFWSADLPTLVTAQYSFVDQTLAAHYGLAKPGEDFGRVEFNRGRRAGLLTLGGLLAAHSKSDATSPIHRGRFVRFSLLCSELPPPPPGVETVLPLSKPGMTTRERFAVHLTDPSCQGCHRFMDPIGFGLENYDAIGRWREQEAGRPVDATGEIVATDVEGPFVGASQLGQMLSRSQEVEACVIDRWFRFAFGRPPDQDDACFLERVRRDFVARGRRLQELPLLLATSEAFAAAPAGGQP